MTSKEVDPLYVIFVSRKQKELFIIVSGLRSMLGWYVYLLSIRRILLANSSVIGCVLS